MAQKTYSFRKRNGLSIVIALCFVFTLTAQVFAGWKDKNEERVQEQKTPISLTDYIHSGHFIQATFENWESEFLQMALYVLLTVSLYQVGSSESKDPGKKHEADREPEAHAKAPWPVKKGGIWLWLYGHSLSITFALLFVISFILHFCGSLKNNNEMLVDKNLPAQTWLEYIQGPTFWFESFQNWQSEFLSVLSIVVLSIWLREKGSPESKPVDAPYNKTGG